MSFKAGAGGFMSGFMDSFNAASDRQYKRAEQEKAAAMQQELFQMQKDAANREVAGKTATNYIIQSQLGGNGFMGVTAPKIGSGGPMVSPEFITNSGRQYSLQDVVGMTGAQQKMNLGHDLSGADWGAAMAAIKTLQPEKLTGELGNLRALYPNLNPDQLLAKQLELKRAGATRINTNNYGNQEKYFAKTIGTAAGDMYSAIRNDAKLATEQLPNLDAAYALLQNDTLETSALAPLKERLGAYSHAIGIDPARLGLDMVDSAQAFNTVAMKNLLAELAMQKGPQTEGDAERAMKTFASLGNTPAANMFAIDYARALAMRKVEKARYIESRLGENPSYKDFNRAESEWLNRITSIPLFRTTKGGLPVTYYQFLERAKSQGADEAEALKEWMGGQ